MRKKTMFSITAITLILIAIAAGTAFGVGNPAKKRDIGKAAAEQYALADAGVNGSEAFMKKTELELEDGRLIYDVEFIAGNKEYDYQIDAATGEIISKDLDIEDVNVKSQRAATERTIAESTEATRTENTVSADSFPVTEAPTTAVPTSAVSETSANTQYIGLEKAKQIALAHAGFSADQVSFSKAELDDDDMQVEYEIEFYHDYMEYDFSIDAFSGAILEYSAEQD